MKRLLLILVLPLAASAQIAGPQTFFQAGSVAGSGGGGGGTVTSISAADSTLTFTPNPITATGTIGLNLASANTWTVPQAVNITGVGTAQTVGFLVENTTLAAAGAQKYSPLFMQYGSGWKTTATAASQIVAFGWQVQPVQGTTAPTGVYQLYSQINGGSLTPVVSTDTSGNTTVAALNVGTTGNTTAGVIALPASNAIIANNSVNSPINFGAAGTNGVIINPRNTNGDSVFANAGANGGILLFLTSNSDFLAYRGTAHTNSLYDNTDNTLSLGESGFRFFQLYLGTGGVHIASGTNAKAGTFTLAAGTATVANTSITANSVIVVTLKTLGGTRTGNPDIVPTATTGFVATELGGITDTSTYSYIVLETN